LFSPPRALVLDSGAGSIEYSVPVDGAENIAVGAGGHDEIGRIKFNHPFVTISRRHSADVSTGVHGGPAMRIFAGNDQLPETDQELRFCARKSDPLRVRTSGTTLATKSDSNDDGPATRRRSKATADEPDKELTSDVRF
jgi:hypothetical protein